MKTNRPGMIWDGGGCAAVASVGLYKACVSYGIKNDFYHQGVSAGALSSAKVVEYGGAVEPLEEKWMKNERDGPQKVFPRSEIFFRGLWSSSLFSGYGLEELVRDLNPKKIVESPTMFEVVTYDEWARQQVLFANTSSVMRAEPELFLNTIRASAGLRGFLPNVMIQGRPHSDGILFSIGAAIKAGCTQIFIFLNDKGGPSVSDTTHSIWYKRLLQDMHDKHELLVEREVKSAIEVNHNLEVFEEKIKAINLGFWRKILFGGILKSLRFTFEGKQPVRLIVMRPSIAISTLDTISFRRGDYMKMIRHCYDEGRRILDKEFRS